MYTESPGQQKRELEASYCDELNELRSRLEELEQERHSLHYKLSESNRERQKLREQLSCVGAGSDASRRQYEEAVRQRASWPCISLLKLTTPSQAQYTLK